MCLEPDGKGFSRLERFDRRFFLGFEKNQNIRENAYQNELPVDIFTSIHLYFFDRRFFFSFDFSQNVRENKVKLSCQFVFATGNSFAEVPSLSSKHTWGEQLPVGTNP